SAKRSIISCVTTCQLETPITVPIFLVSSAIEIAAFCGAFMAGPPRAPFGAAGDPAKRGPLRSAPVRPPAASVFPAPGTPRGPPPTAHRFYPLEPVGPPGALMLLGFLEPALEIAVDLAAGPVTVFRLERRIHDTGDVAGSGEHELDRRAEKLAADEHRF